VATVASKTISQRVATLTVTAGDATPVTLTITQSPSSYLYALDPDQISLSFDENGGSKTFSVITDAPSWLLSANVSWIDISKTSGVAGVTEVTITASKNTDTQTRTARLTLSGPLAPTTDISVSQAPQFYPSYNISPIAADATGMTSTAVQLAAKIKLGWNIGNTMEASGGETNWGNPLISKELIQLVKASGFNAVRIPCAWNQYMDDAANARISASWLNRVKEVVQYCADNGMYVILNIHWDGGWLENNCTVTKQLANNAKQKAFWEQIATKLRDFDEHLLFASANEPNVANATEMEVLNSYHQTFINAVRATGGKNTYRVLVVQGPSTDIQKTHDLFTTLPTDPTPNRMMVEVHYYTPWNFCGLTKDETWGRMAYYWGNGYHSTTDATRNSTWGEEADVDKYMGMMKTQFVDKGIPVVMGEFSATRRSALTGNDLALHLASLAYYTKYVTHAAIANGVLPFYWDNGGQDNNSSGIFDRKNNVVFDQKIVDALVQGAAK
jgi:aryl-phospho-beta-D-glucosidase BglC (GH1 family)